MERHNLPESAACLTFADFTRDYTVRGTRDFMEYMNIVNYEIVHRDKSLSAFAKGLCEYYGDLSGDLSKYRDILACRFVRTRPPEEFDRLVDACAFVLYSWDNGVEIKELSERSEHEIKTARNILNIKRQIWQRLDDEQNRELRDFLYDPERAKKNDGPKYPDKAQKELLKEKYERMIVVPYENLEHILSQRLPAALSEITGEEVRNADVPGRLSDIHDSLVSQFAGAGDEMYRAYRIILKNPEIYFYVKLLSSLDSETKSILSKLLEIYGDSFKALQFEKLLCSQDDLNSRPDLHSMISSDDKNSAARRLLELKYGYIRFDQLKHDTAKDGSDFRYWSVPEQDDRKSKSWSRAILDWDDLRLVLSLMKNEEIRENVLNAAVMYSLLKGDKKISFVRELSGV